MNQNERDDLAIDLGLQDFDVALVEVEAPRRWGPIKVVSVAPRSGSHRCPECGRVVNVSSGYGSSGEKLEGPAACGLRPVKSGTECPHPEARR